MNLFEREPFELPSGIITDFKIECDVLEVKDWESLAHLASKILPPFDAVEGVPRGGMAFAEALTAYSVAGGALLIADDVWVSGLSMERHRDGRDAIGIVAFARNPVASWVTSLFSLNPEAERAAYQ